MKPTKWDMLIFLLILAAALGSFALLWGPGDTVSVSVDGALVYRGSLKKDVTLSLLDGDCVVEIKGGEARVVFSTCPDQTCVHAGAAGRAKPVICLPNRVVVSLGQQEGVDAIVG